MPQSKNHGEILLRGLPTTRFTIIGSDVVFEYEKKNALKVAEWFDDWIDAYVKPQLRRDYEQWLKAAEQPTQPSAVPNPPSEPLDPRIQAKKPQLPAGETEKKEEGES